MNFWLTRFQGQILDPMRFPMVGAAQIQENCRFFFWGGNEVGGVEFSSICCVYVAPWCFYLCVYNIWAVYIFI